MTGSGLCRKRGGVSNSLEAQGHTVHKELTAKVDPGLKKLTVLKTAITETHHW